MMNTKTMGKLTFIASSVVALTAAACSSEKQPAQSANASASFSASAATQSKPAAQNDKDTTVSLSDEIQTGCSMPRTTGAAPHFDYDEAKLHARGADVLSDVATCLIKGPLQDRQVTIIGRTDPRGTDEHNAQLGANRASAARDYLVSRGVPAERISIESRGAQGATGEDEASYALDRRVDVQLSAANGQKAGTPIAKGASLADITKATMTSHKNTKAATYSDSVETGAEGPTKSKAAPLPSNGQ